MSDPEPRQTHARRALACLDLTSLNDDDTAERIDALCDRALAPVLGLGLRPAAVCVFPRFAAQAVARLAGSGVKVAVVVNFPSGDGTVGAVVAETREALADGVDEIDVVVPYRAYLAGRRDEATTLLGAVSHVCRERDEPALMKVILETGVLADHHTIVAAGMDAVDAGAQFLKTSTGKVEPGATPAAVDALLEVIVARRHQDGATIGLKVSGGVRTVDDAAVYLDLADDRLAPDEATPANFRFGASGLLDDIAEVLVGADPVAPSDPKGY